MKLILKLLLVVALCCLVSSSQSSYKSLIQFQIEHSVKSLPLEYYWQGVRLGVPNAENTLRTLALDSKVPYWLDKLMSMDSGETAWQRYLNSTSEQSENRWLKAAAKQGLDVAQFRYALTLNAPSEKEKWLIKSADQGMLVAQIALADWYLLNQQTVLAKPWLELTSKSDVTSQVSLAKLLWNESERERSKQLFSRASTQGNEAAQKHLDIIDNYAPPTQFPNIDFDEGCLQTILVIGDSLDAMVKGKAIVDSFNHDARLADLGICLSKPIWLEEHLNCSDNYNNTHRLGCNLTQVSQWIKQTSASHIVVVGKKGKANVQNGVMYLDALDSYSVFVHELAHFAGFVDEYALNEIAAKAYCGNINATNLLFINDNEFILNIQPLEQMKIWQESPYFSGLYTASTCNNSSVQALKPSSDITFMEYHDSNYIPELYLSLWRDVIKSQRGMRPVLRYLSTNKAVAPQTATGITTKFTIGMKDVTLTHMPNDTFVSLSSFSS